MSLKVLCCCSAGERRSRYCAEYLSQFGYETRYRGVDPRRNQNNPITVEDIKWADVIVCLRPKHFRLLLENFREHLNKPIIVLNVRVLPAEVVKFFVEHGREDLLEIVRDRYIKLQIRRQLAVWLPLEEFVQDWYD